LGRAFSTEEYATGAEPVILLSHGLWRRWGEDPSIIGSMISIAGEQPGGREVFRVIGVLPPGFDVPAAAGMESPDFWLTLPLEIQNLEEQARSGSRTSRNLRVIGRLRPGVSIETARQEAGAVANALAADYPGAYMVAGDRHLTIGVASLLEQTVGRTGSTVVMLLGATGFLLLIGCANVANLLLARATDREKEIALRSALGASRTRIVGQLLTESVLLGTVGGILGAGIAGLGVDLLHTFGPPDFPRLAEVTIDFRVFGFALIVSLITGILFALAPALLTSRTDSVTALKEGGARTTSGRGRNRLRGVLVVAETALALVLLSGAGLLMSSYFRLWAVDPGFDPADLQMTTVVLDHSGFSDEQRVTYFRDLLNGVEAIPGVLSASAVSDPPINGYSMWAPEIFTEGADEGRDFNTHVVGPDYFKTMGIRLIAGRDISDQDDEIADFVVAVSETAAGQAWPNENPLGKRLKISDRDGPWVTVVGLVNDVRQIELASESLGDIYVPYAQDPWPTTMHAIVRTTAGTPTVAAPVREAMRNLNPSVPFDGMRRMTNRISTSVNRPRFIAILWTTFGTAAMLLAAAGIYGTLFFVVGQRSRELGIRVALGATRFDVLGLVVRHGMALAAIGIVIGLAGTLALSRLLASLLFEITPTDPATLAIVTSVLAAVAFFACYVPAWRATRIDPMDALRSE
jgi:putative ABC transport system permease protein